MKILFLMLLFLTAFAHADEIGSQYKKQAEAGDARAQYYLADTPVQFRRQRAGGAVGGKKRQKAVMSTPWRCCRKSTFRRVTMRRLKPSAQQANIAGSKRGAIMLARVLVNTQAGKTDYPQAIALLQSATEDIDSDSAVDAQQLLGLIYANGVEVPQDDVQAASWFKRSSALSRTGYAEYWAGMLFRQGEKGFITPNKQKALYWLNLSCTEGFDTGCEEFDALSGE